MRLIFLLFLIIFLISCENQIKEKKEIQTNVECNIDSDCTIGGCSGQICGTKEKVKGIITTCEWLEEYGCLRLTSCRCINNKCQWEGNEAYKNCMGNIKQII